MSRCHVPGSCWRLWDWMWLIVCVCAFKLSSLYGNTFLSLLQQTADLNDLVGSWTYLLIYTAWESYNAGRLANHVTKAERIRYERSGDPNIYSSISHLGTFQLSLLAQHSPCRSLHLMLIWGGKTYSRVSEHNAELWKVGQRLSLFSFILV